MSLTFIILLFLGVVFIILLVLNILKIINTARATAYSLINKIHCKETACAPAVSSALQIPGTPNASPTSPLDPVAQRFCADLIGRITLKTTPYIVENPPACDLIFAWTDDSNYPSFCLGWRSGSTVFIAIRGTMSYGEILVDLDYIQKPLGTAGTPTTLVHSGFLDLYEKFHTRLVATLRTINPTGIYVTGHSLGAGIASICALSLIKEGFPNTVCYVFASPRVGNIDFVRWVDRTLALFRLENTCDLVPTLPFSVCPNFEDIESPYFYMHAGRVSYYSDNRGSLQNNHLIASYIDFLTSIK